MSPQNYSELGDKVKLSHREEGKPPRSGTAGLLTRYRGTAGGDQLRHSSWAQAVLAALVVGRGRVQLGPKALELVSEA